MSKSSSSGQNHYVYILRCDDDTFYTGYTTDLIRRLNEHNSGKGARYTVPRRPVEIVYRKAFSSRSEACSREHAIKQLSRPQKQKLIARQESNLRNQS